MHSDRHRLILRTPNLFFFHLLVFPVSLSRSTFRPFCSASFPPPSLFLFSSLFLFALCCYGNESQFPPRTMPVTVPTEMQDNAIGCFFFPSRLKSVTRVCTSPTLELTSSVDARWDTSSGRLTECWTNTPSHQLRYQNNSISSPVVRGAPVFLTSTLYNVAKLLTA